ncbi:MAG TPA: Rrf2 family transcriptional regulator [Pyrinomonadaceae bacterium]|jgi:Rrf2 family protein
MASSSSRFAVAVHVLSLLAWAGDEPVKSSSVAASVNTNPVVIRRILCALARARLVTSQSGAAGGSRLARRPARITLGDIYRAVEGGDIFMLHRRRPSQRCVVGANIEEVLGGVLRETNEAVEQALARTTLADIVARIQPCTPPQKRSNQRSNIITRRQQS